MADVITVDRGARPWRPSADAEVVREYHYFDVPLAGVVCQHNVLYLFYCLSDSVDPVSYWSYSRISQAEMDQLDAIESDQEFETALTTRNTEPVVIALAVEDVGVLRSEVVESRSELGSVIDRLAAYLDDLAQRARELAPAS